MVKELLLFIKIYKSKEEERQGLILNIPPQIIKESKR